MSKNAKERLTITQGDFKIAIDGPSEVFGGADLQLKALLSLMQFDFKFQEEDDMDIRTKYYLTILNRLGEVMLWDEYTCTTESNLTYVKHFLDQMIEGKVVENPAVMQFISKFAEEEDEV